MWRLSESKIEVEDPRSRLALLRQFYRDSRYSLIAAVLLIAWHVAYLRSTTASTWWVPWVVYCVALLLLREHWRRVCLRRDDAALAIEDARWRRRAVLGAAGTGVMWGAGLLMAFDPRDSVSQMYCATLACLTCVGSINVMAPLPRAFHALIVPVAATLAALFAVAGSMSGIYEAVLVLVAAAMATGLMHHHARLLLESLELRHERQAALAQLEQAVVARSRFLAAASHDLRQPLHALGLLAAEARAELAGRRAERTALRMQEMVQALDALVDALMDISRIDTQAITLRIRAVALGPLLGRLAAEFAEEAEQRGLQLRLRPTDLWVMSDAVHLERILRNLLSNALRYTTRGGVLIAARLRVADGAPRVELGVWDTGCGIAAADQARVFEEFVQLDNPGRRRTLGMGLGLAIVQRLAQRLQHEVRVHSRLERGSCFTVTLAQASAAERAEETARADAGGLNARSLAGLEVWLVEDDLDILAATTRLLERWGCAVKSSVDGADLRDDAVPHCMICDWRLPAGRNGLDVIRALRAATGAQVRALLISGEAMPAAILTEASLERIDVARKPVPPARLRAWLASEGLPVEESLAP